MAEDKPRVLVIENDRAVASAMARLLEPEGYEVETAEQAAAGLARALEAEFDVVVTDLQMPGISGLQVIERLHAAKPHLPVILMTAYPTTAAAIEATKLGAYDYILKSGDMQYLMELLERIENAASLRRLMKQQVGLGEAELGQEALVGRSAAMQNVYKQIGRVAARPVTVLIRGETGTGKELVARAIYQHSDRVNQPFVVVNCAAIPETLLESELFGHEQGAFTGAHVRRIGRFEQAAHGTIFLDEIGDMTMGTQAKLLRVLQENTIQRLGGRESIKVDVRVIAATHRDLESAIASRQFREDLYYRLNVAVIHLPPLRERREDIPELVRYFLGRHGPELGCANPTISAEAVEFLRQQPWPGNVRELENVVRKSLLLARGYPVTLEHVRSSLFRPLGARPLAGQTISEYVSDLLARAICGELQNVQTTLMETVERELYSQAIRLAQGNQARAAKWLGVSRPTMREKLIQHGLHPGREKPGL